MATSGKTAIPITHARREIGGVVRRAPEKSSQTFPVGALLIRSAGSIVMGATGTAQSTGLVGFAKNSGQNLTTNGLAKCEYFRFKAFQPIKIVLPGVWTGSAHRGVTAGFSMDTAGSVVLQTTAASVGTIISEVEWDSGVAVADGDSNVVVYFQPAQAALAE